MMPTSYFVPIAHIRFNDRYSRSSNHGSIGGIYIFCERGQTDLSFRFHKKTQKH